VSRKGRWWQAWTPSYLAKHYGHLIVSAHTQVGRLNLDKNCSSEMMKQLILPASSSSSSTSSLSMIRMTLVEANDEIEIPMLAKDRMVIVEKIVRRVEKEGISLDNLLIDPLAMPVGADPENVKNTLETIYLIKEKYGLNMSIGASNVSFGLPNRHALNAAFMPMAMSMGLTSAIMDGRTPEVVQAVRAADLLLGLDQWGANWITNFRANKEA
jgi:tetrahydromethanopterin S-methyltransferase subunit H